MLGQVHVPVINFKTPSTSTQILKLIPGTSTWPHLMYSYIYLQYCIILAAIPVGEQNSEHSRPLSIEYNSNVCSKAEHVMLNVITLMWTCILLA